MNQIDQIKKIRDNLKELLAADASGRVSIMVETSEDEAMMLGTIDGYLRFTEEVLEKVIVCMSDNGENVDFNGVSIPFTAIGESLDHDAHIVVRSIGLASSEKECETTLEVLKNN